ncbi:hypothetical protein B0H13DRAFT_2539360 [Mycena leptocephala]|nr:hypothetical protein B0H13DRAFT_2539360 [Mycena leptocephala]
MGTLAVPPGDPFKDHLLAVLSLHHAPRAAAAPKVEALLSGRRAPTTRTTPTSILKNAGAVNGVSTHTSAAGVPLALQLRKPHSVIEARIQHPYIACAAAAATANVLSRDGFGADVSRVYGPRACSVAFFQIPYTPPPSRALVSHAPIPACASASFAGPAHRRTRCLSREGQHLHFSSPSQAIFAPGLNWHHNCVVLVLDAPRALPEYCPHTFSRERTNEAIKDAETLRLAVPAVDNALTSVTRYMSHLSHLVFHGPYSQLLSFQTPFSLDLISVPTLSHPHVHIPSPPYGYRQPAATRSHVNCVPGREPLDRRLDVEWPDMVSCRLEFTPRFRPAHINADSFIDACVARLGSFRRCPSPHHPRFLAFEVETGIGSHARGGMGPRSRCLGSRGARIVRRGGEDDVAERRWSGWTTEDENGARDQHIRLSRLRVSSGVSSSKNRCLHLLERFGACDRGSLVACLHPVPLHFRPLFCVRAMLCPPRSRDTPSLLPSCPGDALWEVERQRLDGTKREGEVAHNLRGSLISQLISYATRDTALVQS